MVVATVALPALVRGAGADSAEMPQVAVTAPRPATQQELSGDSVPRFVATHGRPAVATRQLPRWRTAVCPVASGLEPAFNQFVSARIVAVADSVGAPHRATEQCKPNVQILFTTQPEKMIAEFAKRTPSVLGFHYQTEAKGLATFSHPIQGWYVTETQGDNGAIVVDRAMPIQLMDAPPSNPGARAFESAPVPAGRAGTRLATGRSSWLAHVLIIADRNRMTGYTIGALSDYLAMLTLSQTRSPDTCGQLPSILDLMAAECADHERPQAMTAGDLAFLKALYFTDLREGLDLEQSDIETHMRRQLVAH
jgi:hypothetical protein